uniref:tRNA-uridine aminocarboxypropyltransferase 1 n=1 Tax=Cyprinus carpio TaxID=7962 RepID=A0A8C2JB81_CYPCA
MSDQDRSALSGLLLASHAPLDDAQRAGRMKCSRCGASRMFYCYSCCALVGLEPRDVPSVKLPVKIDIIKHPHETDGKSTAVQAKLLAPQDVTIYTYPCIPELDHSAENILLVFPAPDAMTLEELWEHFSADGEPRVKRVKVSEADPDARGCPIQRVVFIDCTWNQTTRIITDERLQGRSFLTRSVTSFTERGAEEQKNLFLAASERQSGHIPGHNRGRLLLSEGPAQPLFL